MKNQNQERKNKMGLEIFMVVTDIICAILLAIYIIAYQDLKHKTELDISKLKEKNNILEIQLSFYKKNINGTIHVPNALPDNGKR